MVARNCLLLEDSPEMGILLKNALSGLGLYCLKQAYTAEEAIAALRSEKFDILFVDIRLGESSGLEFVRSHPNLPPVVIISAYPEYAIDAYDVEIIADFVPKPFTPGRLSRAINRAIGAIYQDNAIIEKDFAFLQSGRKIVKVAYKDIDFIKAYGVYSKLYQNSTYSLVNEPISTLDASLPGKIFRRVHKSYVLNLQKITGYDHKFFYAGHQKVPIGVTYRESLKPLFRLFGDDSPK